MGCGERTLLDAAAVGGNEDVVRGLLRVGAQPEVNVVSCSSKRSVLYTATTLGHKAVARRLMVAGADVNFRDPVPKRSVLYKYEATMGGHEQLVDELLIGGANPNWRNIGDGVSPLHVGASQGFDKIVSTLLLRGAEKDALDRYERTPLIRASFRGRQSVVKTLLDAGIDESIRGTDGDSALDLCAASVGNGDVIEAIVGHGADVNARRDDGFTALHIAAQYDQAGAVDALIKGWGRH